MPSNRKLERGSVVLVPFPNSDLKTRKLRPGLVVQSNDLETELAQVIIAMITSNMGRAGRSSRVSVIRNTEIGRQSGLLSDSVVMADNLATILLSRIHAIIGRIADMTEVDVALCHSLDV